MPCQAPGPSNRSRSCSAPSPWRSILLWMSSTSVELDCSGVKRISTSLALAGSISATHSGLSCPGPMCHERHKWRGGSQWSTLPQSQRSPLALRTYQRPPTRGSMKMASNGVLPMWWVAGHQVSICSTKTLQARSMGAFTRTLLNTLRSSSAGFTMFGSYWRFFRGGLKVAESLRPHLIEVGAQSGHALGVELIEAAGAGAVVEHEASIFQHLQVL